MSFRLVEASPTAACTHVDDARRRGRIWPVYETSELMLARAEIAGDDTWNFKAGDFTYFFFVEAGRISLILDDDSRTFGANRSVEVPENRPFRIVNASPDEPAWVVMLAGREVLPGSFFNTFSSVYLDS